MADGRIHQREYRRIIERDTRPALLMALGGAMPLLLAIAIEEWLTALLLAVWSLGCVGYPLGLRVVRYVDMDLDKQQRTEAENNMIAFVRRRHWSYRWLLYPLLWLWLWWSYQYAKRNKHRGRSHQFLVGTVDRFIHFLGLPALLTFFLAPVWAGVFAGMVVQDESHRRLDGMT